MSTIRDVMTRAPVIPVLVINDVARARSIAETFVAGGLPVLEVTLRTPSAIEAIRIMLEVPGAIVGAGTVLDAAALDKALAAGAQFIVSPGLTRPLAQAAIGSGVPFLPGTATASDLMRGLDLGLTHFKFFPAMAAGGTPALKALLGPFGGVSICPTGGITADNAAAWLAIPQVLCVGGSWMMRGGVVELSAVAAAAAIRPQ